MKPIYVPKGKAREYSELACNLYSGCEHGCRYCYVPNITRDREGFHVGSKPRTGIVSAFRNQAAGMIRDPREILFCFMCDPYQVGRDNSTTSRVLAIAEACKLNIQVLTKGGMEASVDFGVMERNGWKFAQTMMGLIEERRKVEEPKAATIESRVEALTKARERGIHAWVSVEPVLDPDEALEMMSELKGLVSFWKVGKLNHDKAREAEIDWPRFRERTKEVLSGCGYYLKRDLVEAK